jgi:phage protein U
MAIAKLGEFIFSVHTASFQTLERRSSYSWASIRRLGRKPALQWIGQDSSTISLKGIIRPRFRGGFGQMAELKEMAVKGIPYQLTYSDAQKAQDAGLWCIKEIEEGRSYFSRDGFPLKIEFEIELVEYGEDSIQI